MAEGSRAAAPSASNVTPLEPHNPVDRVIETVHADLVFGHLKPRERLVEAEMAERYDAPRSVIRRALEELEQRGVVRKPPNKGAVVHDFSLKEVQDICELRVLLQRHATETLPLPADEEWLGRLHDLQVEHAAAVAARDVSAAYHVNRAFHGHFFSAAPNAHLLRRIAETNWLLDIVRSYRMLGPALNTRAPREHAAIVEAARAADRESLVRLCVEHVPSAEEIYHRIGAWGSR